MVLYVHLYYNMFMTVLMINKRFEELLPPLSIEEFSQLEANILAEGVRDPLVVWSGRHIIIDGHNRHNIANKHGLSFRTVELPFEDEDAVCEWMIENQMGKRNLTDAQRTFQIGELYQLKKKRHGGDRKNSSIDGSTREKIAKQHGVGETTVQRACVFHTAVIAVAETTGKHVNDIIGIADKTNKQDIVRMSKLTPQDQEKTVEKILSGEAQSFIDAVRLNKQEFNRNNPDFNTSGKYRIIYADPPWKYDNRMTGKWSSAEDHYPTMSTEDICKIPVKDMTQDNAVLFLWVTSPILEEAFDVINAWGFKYKSSFIWDKQAHGMGHYNSVRHEFLFICTKGSCRPDVNTRYNSVVSIMRSKVHSEKPERFREMIDEMYPNGKRIELFGRKKVRGWDVLGNQVSNEDNDVFA